MLAIIAALVAHVLGIAVGWALRGTGSWCPTCGSWMACTQCPRPVAGRLPPRPRLAGIRPVSHPHWCDRKACTIGEPAQQYCVARRTPARKSLPAARTTPSTCSWSKRPAGPKEVVVSMAWHRSSTVALDVHSLGKLHEATAALLDLLAEPQGCDA